MPLCVIAVLEMKAQKCKFDIFVSFSAFDDDRVNIDVTDYVQSHVWIW